MLLVNSEKLRAAGACGPITIGSATKSSQNTPWDEFVRERSSPRTGSTLENGAANFFVLHQDPTELAETISVAFLGMTINCAKCHNHPLEKWTNDQYYAMANLFARVRSKDLAGRTADGDRLSACATGELVQPRTGKPQPPCAARWHSRSRSTLADDRRMHLARWLTSPENPYFSRAITNRVWANFFGVGLVEKVDDLRLTNPASNEELLAAAAKYLVDNHYDLKALMRAILQSSTYQRSSQPLPETSRRALLFALLSAAADGRSHARRLSQVTGRADAVRRLSGRLAGDATARRRTSTPTSSNRSAGPPAMITCECERTAAAHHGAGAAHH